MTKKEIIDSVKEKIKRAEIGNKVVSETYYCCTGFGALCSAKLFIEKVKTKSLAANSSNNSLTLERHIEDKTYEVEVDLTKEVDLYAKAP